MDANQLRGILDRFDAALRGIEEWAETHRARGEQHPQANVELHEIWIELECECQQMLAVDARILELAGIDG